MPMKKFHFQNSGCHLEFCQKLKISIISKALRYRAILIKFRTLWVLSILYITPVKQFLFSAFQPGIFENVDHLKNHWRERSISRKFLALAGLQYLIMKSEQLFYPWCPDGQAGRLNPSLYFHKIFRTCLFLGNLESFWPPLDNCCHGHCFFKISLQRGLYKPNR